MTKKIIIFADGTGNAFATQESNVWRLYQAVDTSDPAQIAYYIPGVGTSGFKPFAMLDGATGIGVPSNVRKLYRFLCWNYAPDESGNSPEIYMFGFSRGAFTIRTLVAMIESQGLAPRAVDGAPATHQDMVRYSKAAWREYRRQSAPWTRTLPTIWATRAVRDALLFVRNGIGGLFGQKTWSQVVAGRDRNLAGKDARGPNADSDPGIAIKFVGLFDTVEAYGVPIEELRRAIDWSIWPISFRNRRVSKKVENVRHALAIDDERTTFHPLRFDMADEDISDDGRDRIREVWFAGVHSDVGGGYPDGGLSYVPLQWLAHHAEQCGLKLKAGALQGFEEKACALAPMHDSRSGGAVFYRYEPRKIERDEKGRTPLVHYSVAEKMVFGSDNYAPVTLPADSRFLGPDGVAYEIEKIQGDNPDADSKRSMMVQRRANASEPAKKNIASAMTALKLLHRPDATHAGHALDAVWWRRVAYFLLLFTALLVVVIPQIVDSLSDKAYEFAGEAGSTAEAAVRAVLTPLQGALEAVLPGYAKPYIEALVRKPLISLFVVAVAIGFWLWGKRLRDIILDFARLAWNSDARGAVRDPGHVFLRFAKFARGHKSATLHHFVTRYAFPGLATILLLGGLGLIVGRTWFSLRVGLGAVCFGSTGAPKPVDEAGASFAFATSDFCKPSGVSVEADHKYRIWITMKEPWFDRSIMTGVNGFSPDLRHALFNPMKRNLSAAWFQPVLRVGRRGAAEIALAPLDSTTPEKNPRWRIAAAADPEGCGLKPGETGWIAMPFKYDDSCAYTSGRLAGDYPGYRLTIGNFEKMSGDTLAAARSVWERQGLPRVLVADFTPALGGELFLYVNDAVGVFPFVWWPQDQFYGNNSGTADVRVQKLPLPASPPKAP